VGEGRMLLRLFPRKEDEELLKISAAPPRPHQNKTASTIAQVFAKRAQLLRQSHSWLGRL
jgi:hypothetical protein